MGIELKIMKLFLALAALVGFASAGCPNGCSGHGSCGTSDVCGCYKGFFGGDCSYRYCPVGPSWTVTPIEKLLDDRYSEMIVLNTPGGFVGHNKFDKESTKQYPIKQKDFKDTFEALYPKRPNFNQYTECSSRGTCDYATGECKCFDGFEGRGCRRTSCPNSCSGHGRCLDNYDINKDQYNSFNYPNDQMWDQKRTQSCKCDRGYTGYDCNSRVCPFGDDPTSDCGENSAGDVQLVVTHSLQNPSKKDSLNKYFTLTFTDMFGGEFTTRPILDHAKSCKQDPVGTATPCPEIQYALMDLPNFAIPGVEVDAMQYKTTGSGDTGKTTSLYTVQFTDSSNSGKQNTLKCETITDTKVAGAQPKYEGVELCKVYNVGGPEWFDYTGDERKLNIKATFKDVTADQTIKLTLGETDAKKITLATTYEDFQPCSSKGDCDAATGTCTCNSGHYGEACEKQSTYY